jgi:hypothetical protein
MRMLYKKININLIVPADEAEAVVAGLNASLDVLEEKHTLFGGEIEVVDVEHRGTKKDRRSRIHWLLAKRSPVPSRLRVGTFVRLFAQSFSCLQIDATSGYPVRV